MNENILNGWSGLTPRTFMTDPMAYLRAAAKIAHHKVYKETFALSGQSWIAITTKPIFEHIIAYIVAPRLVEGRRFYEPPPDGSAWINGIRYFWSPDAPPNEVRFFELSAGVVFAPVMTIVECRIE